MNQKTKSIRTFALALALGAATLFPRPLKAQDDYYNPWYENDQGWTVFDWANFTELFDGLSGGVRGGGHFDNEWFGNFSGDGSFINEWFGADGGGNGFLNQWFGSEASGDDFLNEWFGIESSGSFQTNSVASQSTKTGRRCSSLQATCRLQRPTISSQAQTSCLCLPRVCEHYA